MIYVPFFPLQIPIYFEFLPLIRYEFNYTVQRYSPVAYFTAGDVLPEYFSGEAR